VNVRISEWLVPADELAEAVVQKFLSQDEARLIYWSQFPILAQQDKTNPPEVT
jgi:hypothetical protein